MASEPAPVFLFGEFRLDPANYRLERAGRRVPLAPKTLQLLFRLVQSAGTLVTKEELRDTLWPGQAVHESNLNRQVTLLRQHLGQSEWVVSEPRIGYRFVADVRLEERLVEKSAKARPVIVVAIAMAILMAAAAAMWYRNRAAPESRIRSLAVLPLRPIGSDADIAHIGVGVADALINQLSMISALEVRPTSAVSKYAGVPYDSSQVGRDLGVEAVLEGTIQREHDRVRVRVQLVDLHRNLPVFSGKFDEPASDLFALEDIVAGAVTRALALEMAPGDRAQVEKRRSRVAGAYEAYLKGRYEWSRRSPEGLKSSIAYYQEAIDRDDQYAAAYAGLGDSYNLLSMHRVATPAESFPRAKEAAAKALSLDDSLADAHVTLGTAAFYYDYDWPAAERHFRRAIALDPRQASARHFLANLLIATGRVDDGLEMMNEARAREPYSVSLISIAAYQHYLIRRHDEALQLVSAALDRDNSYAQAYAVRSLVLSALGKHIEAQLAAERYADLRGTEYSLTYVARAIAADPQRRHEAPVFGSRLRDLFDLRKISPFDLVRYYTALDDEAQALRWLDETRNLRDPGMVWLAVEPMLDPIRDTARYRQLLKVMKLEEADARLHGKKSAG